MTRALWLLPILGALFGGVELLVRFNQVESAPQQAVLVTSSIAAAVIPYVLVRGIMAMIEDRQDATATQTKLLAAIANKLNPVE